MYEWSPSIKRMSVLSLFLRNSFNNSSSVEYLLYILKKLLKENKINQEKFNKIIIKSYDLFHLYNNNYRPIYHLEKIIYYILNYKHECKECV